MSNRHASVRGRTLRDGLTCKLELKVVEESYTRDLKVTPSEIVLPCAVISLRQHRAPRPLTRPPALQSVLRLTDPPSDGRSRSSSRRSAE